MSVKQRMVSRRDFLRLAGLAGGAALLGACQAQPTEAPTQAAVKATEAPTQAPQEEEVTISWWNQFSTVTCQETFPKVIDEFEALYPNITVEYEISGGPPGGGDYIEVLLARIAAGNAPNTATLWSPPSQFGARGSLTAIDELMADARWAKPDAFYEAPLGSCQWDGKTYGLPASAGAGCIFINTAKFEEKGISIAREDFPATWGELKTLSEKFIVWEGEELKQVGFVPWTAGWLKPMWSQLNGGKLFDVEAIRYVIDSGENVEWLEYWVGWLDDQYGGDIEQMNLYGAWGDVYPDTAFYLEQSAIDMSGSWACTDAEIPFEWEVCKFPVGPSGSKSVTAFWPNWWVIPKGAANLDESFLLAEYFCTQGWVTWYKQVMDTPAWKNFPEGVLTEKLVEKEGAERAQEIHNFFAQYLEDACEMWNSPIEDYASDALDSAIDEVLHKTKTAGEALKEAQDIIQANLEDELAAL
jgi:ABC-type glycerol-3-phosphate transport system substrate-binding protein